MPLKRAGEVNIEHQKHDHQVRSPMPITKAACQSYTKLSFVSDIQHKLLCFSNNNFNNNITFVSHGHLVS